MSSKRAAMVTGVLGMAGSDAAMYALMHMASDPIVRPVVFWLGAVGAAVGYGGWLLWLTVDVRGRAGSVGGGALLDGVLIGLSSAVAFALTVVVPQYRVTGFHADQLWMLGCLVGDAVLAWLAVVVVVVGPRQLRSILVVLGLGLHVAVDVLHSAALPAPGPGRTHLGLGLLAVVFVLWAAVLGLGATSPAASTQPGGPSSTVRVARLRGLGLVVALALPGTLLAARLWPVRQDEAVLFVVATPVLAALAAARIRGLVVDLSATNAELVHLAHHDQLTGLGNRAALADWLGPLELAQSLRAVLYLDLDGFKAVNDTHGHAAGDAVLVEVAERIRLAVRGADRVARVGGDEFVVIVSEEDTDVDAFVDRLDRLLNHEPYAWHGHRLDVGVSVGVARSIAEGGARSSGDALISQADAAMLASKNARRTGRPHPIRPAAASFLPG